ncbi:MAG: peptide ABC transporter substrate-binding protein [Pseudohongiellaceae bacterium]|nr:peptide ABC transporter substrate-binding protein [Pseudohongiellaceae bacterium]
MPKSVVTEDKFNRSAGKQLARYALVAVLALVALMYCLNWVAGLSSSGSAAGLTAIDVERNEISTFLRQEPPQLNSMLASDAVSGTILEHVMEGLLRYGPNNEILPGMAERWEIDGALARFWIRPDARWSNGDPVTAHDFEFAWKTALDPATGSQYSFIFYPIKNAEAANTGQLPLEAVGVRALDDSLLEVELERPLAYLEKLLAFVTFQPVQQKFYEQRPQRYGADAEDLLYNGPFVISSWVHGASMRLEKNPNYWDAERIKLNAINFPYITSDSATLLNLYRDGRIATVDLTAEMLEGAMQRRWQLERFMDGTVFFIDFNHRDNRLTRNKNLRIALNLAQDSNELVNSVIKLPGYLPAKSLFPIWMQGVEKTFREEYPAPEYPYNVELARQHLALAKQELGLSEWPPIVLLSGNTPVANISAQYYQEVFKKNLGLEIIIDAQIFRQRLQKMQDGDFDMVLSGWGPDYNDPMTFADLYSSWNLNNRGKYSNPELDALVRKAQDSIDPKERMDAFGAIQEILHDDAVLIGNYERGLVHATDPRLKGAQKRIFGAENDYTGAYIEDSE